MDRRRAGSPASWPRNSAPARSCSAPGGLAGQGRHAGVPYPPQFRSTDLCTECPRRQNHHYTALGVEDWLEITCADDVPLHSVGFAGPGCRTRFGHVILWPAVAYRTWGSSAGGQQRRARMIGALAAFRRGSCVERISAGTHTDSGVAGSGWLGPWPRDAKPGQTVVILIHETCGRIRNQHARQGEKPREMSCQWGRENPLPWEMGGAT